MLEPVLEARQDTASFNALICETIFTIAGKKPNQHHSSCSTCVFVGPLDCFLGKRHLYGKHSGSMGCHQSSERVLVALSELQLVAGYLENKKTNVFSCVHLSKKVHGDRVACKVFSIVSKFNCLRYCQFYECALSLSSIQTLSVKLAKMTFS